MASFSCCEAVEVLRRCSSCSPNIFQPWTWQSTYSIFNHVHQILNASTLDGEEDAAIVWWISDRRVALFHQTIQDATFRLNRSQFIAVTFQLTLQLIDVLQFELLFALQIVVDLLKSTSNIGRSSHMLVETFQKIDTFLENGFVPERTKTAQKWNRRQTRRRQTFSVVVDELRKCFESVVTLVSVNQRLPVQRVHDPRWTAEVESIESELEFVVDAERFDSRYRFEFANFLRSVRRFRVQRVRILRIVDGRICEIHRDVRFPEAKREQIDDDVVKKIRFIPLEETLARWRNLLSHVLATSFADTRSVTASNVCFFFFLIHWTDLSEDIQIRCYDISLVTFS